MGDPFAYVCKRMLLTIDRNSEPGSDDYENYYCPDSIWCWVCVGEENMRVNESKNKLVEKDEEGNIVRTLRRSGRNRVWALLSQCLSRDMWSDAVAGWWWSKLCDVAADASVHIGILLFMKTQQNVAVIFQSSLVLHPSVCWRCWPMKGLAIGRMLMFLANEMGHTRAWSVKWACVIFNKGLLCSRHMIASLGQSCGWCTGKLAVWGCTGLRCCCLRQELRCALEDRTLIDVASNSKMGLCIQNHDCVTWPITSLVHASTCALGLSVI